MSYVYLAWFIKYFLYIFVAYGVIRGLWKIRGITRLAEKGGLRVRRFVSGRGGAGLAIGLAGMAVTVAALVLPWYAIKATLAGASSPVQIMTLDGLRGFSLNLTQPQSPGALVNTVSVDAPFAVIFAVGMPLLLLDVIAVRRGGSLGRRFIDGAIALLFAFAFIFAFVTFLPYEVPGLSSLLSGGSLSPQGTALLTSVGSSALGGSASSPLSGYSSASWAFGLGAYLFIAGAVLRIVGGAVMSTAPDLVAPAVPPPGAAVSTEPTRRLAAIMFTDIVGYTALTQSDESLAMKVLDKHRKILRPVFAKYSGREVKTIGDAFLVEFNSALEATECAVEMQKTQHDYNETAKEKDRVRLKIGIHVGDVIHKDGDVLGDAVNIASRIEPLAVGGGICISEQVYDQVRNKVPYTLVKLQPKELKNVSFQIDTYRVQLPWESPPAPQDGTTPPKPPSA